jgi:hypothetical protein
MQQDEQSDQQDPEERQPPCKLDLGYFTHSERCPLMVRHRARRAFELFLFLADCSLRSWGQPVSPSHEAMCLACGLEPQEPASKPEMSRLLRLLRDVYGVIEYEPVRNRRPTVRLRPATDVSDPINPRHYIHFRRGWSKTDRQTFAALGARAFPAEYMYFLCQYESALAERKHGRAYWFFPLERISATFHVSRQFAAVGLRALVELGVMHVRYGQYLAAPAGGEIARANRFYFLGLSEVYRRDRELQLLRAEYEADFDLAQQLAVQLTNGRTVKNVRGLCQLIAQHGQAAVNEAVAKLGKYQRRNPRRRLAYLTAMLKLQGG